MSKWVLDHSVHFETPVYIYFLVSLRGWFFLFTTYIVSKEQINIYVPVWIYIQRNNEMLEHHGDREAAVFNSCVL